MKYIFTSLIVVILLSSCKLLLNIGGYYKPPKERSEENIIQYAKKYGAYYNALLAPSSLNDFYKFESYNKSIPTVKIYNNKFYLLNSINGKNCPWATIQSFNDIKSLSVISSSDSDYKHIVGNLKLIDGNDDFLKTRNFDYLLVYDWAQYTPKFAKEIFKSINQIKSESKNKAPVIKIISINLDVRAGW